MDHGPASPWGLRCVVPLSRRMAANEPVDKDIVRSLYRATVGVVSTSHVGRRVIERLRPYDTRILLFDPFVDQDEADRLGRRACGAGTRWPARATPSPATRRSCPRPTTCWARATSGPCGDDTIFVNTSRGGQHRRGRPHTRAREGPPLRVPGRHQPGARRAGTSPLRTLPNVVLTPHIAGAKSYRTGAMAAEELCRFFTGRPQIHQVTRDMLPVIA